MYTLDLLRQRAEHDATNNPQNTVPINPIIVGFDRTLNIRANVRHHGFSYPEIPTELLEEVVSTTFEENEEHLIATKNTLLFLNIYLKTVLGTSSTTLLANYLNNLSRRSVTIANNILAAFVTNHRSIIWTKPLAQHDIGLLNEAIPYYIDKRRFLTIIIALVTDGVLPISALKVVANTELTDSDAPFKRTTSASIRQTLRVKTEAFYYHPPELTGARTINTNHSELDTLFNNKLNSTPNSATIASYDPRITQILAEITRVCPTSTFGLTNRETHFLVRTIMNTYNPSDVEEIMTTNPFITPRHRRIYVDMGTPVQEEPVHQEVREEPVQPAEEQGCCKIGLELEFWSDGMSSQFFEQENIQKEYYRNQYELNDFISDFKTKKDIRTFFRSANRFVKDFRKRSPFKTTFGTVAHQIDNRSVVFNGCHLHISLPTVNETYGFCKYLRKHRIIERFKFENFPSVRSIMSHHIWGNSRDSEYNYKQKRKFQPVVFTSRNTIEIRIWDNEDILNLGRADKIAALIVDSMKDYRENTQHTPWVSKILEINSIENLYAIFETLKDSLKKNPNKHSIEEESNTVILPSKQRLQFRLNGDESHTLKLQRIY